MRQLTVFILLLTALVATAATDYATLQLKADRFFAQEEWLSAQAMLDLMLEQKPDVAATYGRAIVVAAMRGDSVGEMSLMRRSINHYVPFDSTFAAVRAISLKLGKTHLYERFLLMVRADQPWLERTIDSYLMRYYTFRRDPAMMVKYSRIMLEGMPDNVEFLTTLAQGQMQGGDSQAAMATYRRILKIDPDNYNALLEIGNFGFMNLSAIKEWQRQEAFNALTRAYELKPTPYVAQMLRQMTAPDQTK